MENLEEAYDVDLTSNSPTGKKNRAQFLDLVERFSPKDSSGNISEYADFEQVFDVFQKSQTSDNTRQKDLASRGMVRSGSSSSKATTDAQLQYLKDAGII